MRLLNTVFIVALMFMFGCGNKSCTYQELNFNVEVKSVARGIVQFDLRDMVNIDSLYVYEPYTPAHTIEAKHSCKFPKYDESVENECLLVIKTKNKGLVYTIVWRKIDFSSLKGEYSLEDIGLIEGREVDGRYLLSFQ